MSHHLRISENFGRFCKKRKKKEENCTCSQQDHDVTIPRSATHEQRNHDIATQHTHTSSVEVA